MNLRGEIFRNSDYKLRDSKHVSNGICTDTRLSDKQACKNDSQCTILVWHCPTSFYTKFYLRFNNFNVFVLILYEHTKLNCKMTNQIYDSTLYDTIKTKTVSWPKKKV